MKYVFVSLLVLAAWSRADLVLEQRVDSGGSSSNLVIKCKDDQVRMDAHSDATVEVSVLVNTTAGEIVTLMHEGKKFLKISIEMAKKQAALNAKAAGIDQAKIEKAKSTGKKEKVGEWEAEIYKAEIGGKPAKLWVVKDFPNYKSITDRMNKLATATGGTALDPSKLGFDGMVVKSEMESPVGKVVTTLVKAKEETVDASVFATPEGYEDMARSAE